MIWSAEAVQRRVQRTQASESLANLLCIDDCEVEVMAHEKDIFAQIHPVPKMYTKLTNTCGGMEESCKQETFCLLSRLAVV